MKQLKIGDKVKVIACGYGWKHSRYHQIGIILEVRDKLQYIQALEDGYITVWFPDAVGEWHEHDFEEEELEFISESNLQLLI